MPVAERRTVHASIFTFAFFPKDASSVTILTRSISLMNIIPDKYCSSQSHLNKIITGISAHARYGNRMILKSWNGQDIIDL